MDARLLRIANRLLVGMAFLLALPPVYGQESRESLRITIDPRTPLMELLPPTPLVAMRLPTWLDDDLTQASEVMFGEPISPKPTARQQTASAVAKINHLNSKNRDGFMEALIAQRADLRGLPFRMGDECRTEAEQARLLRTVAPDIRDAVAAVTFTDKVGKAGRKLEHLWWEPTQTNRRAQVVALPDDYDRALVGAMMQILAPEPASFRVGLAKFLTELPGADATKALANLAIFSSEEEVRSAAIDGLRKRPAKDYTETLLRGFQYPLPATAQRSAYALAKLERKDLIANLIDVLDQPDPRMPIKKSADDAEVFVVREVVKVNHLRNCLLCHSPGDTPDVPQGVIQAPVPVPGQSLTPQVQYYQSTLPSPNIVVRIDTTYLRQDFSVMMPVENAKPWPDRQRFDFLVRARELTPKQAAEYQEQAAKRSAGKLSPYHRAALFALRELTGRDTEPTAAAWRKLLKLAAK